jgi:uncharacterized membrane protein
MSARGVTPGLRRAADAAADHLLAVGLGVVVELALVGTVLAAVVAVRELEPGLVVGLAAVGSIATAWAWAIGRALLGGVGRC